MIIILISAKPKVKWYIIILSLYLEGDSNVRFDFKDNHLWVLLFLLKVVDDMVKSVLNFLE